MTDDVTSGVDADDGDKLLPEWNRPADEQVIWLALGVLAVLAFVFFGISRLGDSASSITEPFTVDSSDSVSTIGGFLDSESDLGFTQDLFDKADISSDLGRSGAGPYTVLAPTDDAWEDLAAAIEFDGVDDFLDEIDDAEADDAVGFHVIEGEYTLSELEDEGTLTTINGAMLTFGNDLVNGSIEFDEPDIELANGIVHRIAGVLP